MDCKNVKTEFGKRVKYYRKLKKITQFELANIIGKSEDTISNIERGIPSTGIELMYHIAKALDVEVVQFFDEDSIKTISNFDVKRNLLYEEIVGLLKTRDEDFIRHLIAVLQEK